MTLLDALTELHKHPEAWQTFCQRHRWIPVVGPRSVAPFPSPRQVAERIEAHAGRQDRF